MSHPSYIRASAITEAILGMMRTPTAGLRFTPSQGKALVNAIQSRASLPEPELERGIHSAATPATEAPEDPADHFISFVLQKAGTYIDQFPQSSLLCHADIEKDTGKLHILFKTGVPNCLIFSMPEMYDQYNLAYPNRYTIKALRSHLRQKPYWVAPPTNGPFLHRFSSRGSQMACYAINLCAAQHLINPPPHITQPIADRIIAQVQRNKRSLHQSSIRYTATKAFDLIGDIMADKKLSPAQAVSQLMAITEQTIFPAQVSTEESRPTSPAIRHLQNSLKVLDHNIEIALLKGDTEEAVKDTAQANDIRQAIAILQEHLKP